MRHNYLRLVLCAGSSLAITYPALADITGKIDATITLEAGCIINEDTHDSTSAGANYGTINFGSHNTFFETADQALVSATSGIKIQCSPGITPTITFESGLNDGEGAGSGAHAMAHDSDDAKFVTYDIFSDPAYSLVLPSGTPQSLASTGEELTFEVYGRAYGEDFLIPGSYSDEITVKITL